MVRLPANAEVVARALLASPNVRPLTARQLADRFHVSTMDAREGIASVTALARRRGTGDLLRAHALALAIGENMNLDRAMARYGSNVGPRTYSPSPVFADAGADLGYVPGDGGGTAPIREATPSAPGDNRGAVQVGPTLKEAPPPPGPYVPPAPPPAPEPEPSIVSRVPWYVWAGGAVAAGLVVFGRKKKKGKR